MEQTTFYQIYQVPTLKDDSVTLFPLLVCSSQPSEIKNSFYLNVSLLSPMAGLFSTGGKTRELSYDSSNTTKS